MTQEQITDMRENIVSLEKERDELWAKVAELQAIVDRLPKTADGVIVVPGSRLFMPNGYEIKGGVGGFMLNKGQDPSMWPACCSFRICDCYSTREAALAAQAQKDKPAITSTPSGNESNEWVWTNDGYERKGKQ